VCPANPVHSGGGKALQQASLPVQALVCSFEVADRLQALLSLRFISLVWMMVAKRVLTEILQSLRKLNVSCDLGRSHRSAYA
jgi:hypothetical protein